jgi:CxxC-x17-CxxC domain-containing protein
LHAVEVIHVQPRAWRAESRGKITEGDVAKILRTRAPGEMLVCLIRRVSVEERAEGASSMEFRDKMLKCIDCGVDFVFTSGEQLFFHDKQFRVCSQCGKETTVPFRPTQGRPVLCRDCFQQRRTAASA